MEELKEKIKQLIVPNGKNAITAQVLQSVLLEIVDELNDKNQDESTDAIIESIIKLEQADAAIVGQLQGQVDAITANATAIEDLNSQIGDIDTILTEIIGGE